jgi:hypothetical protein
MERPLRKEENVLYICIYMYLLDFILELTLTGQVKAALECPI